MHENLTPNYEEIVRRRRQLGRGLVSLLEKRRAATSPERFRDTTNLASMVGAPEVKLAILLKSWVLGPASDRTIYHALMKSREESHPGWAPKFPGQYFHKGFIPDIAFTQRIPSTRPAQYQSAEGFALLPEHEERVMSVVGLLADWSLKYPDISLQQILGAPHSRGKYKSAEVRLNLLLEALTHPAGENLALTETIGLTNIPRETVSNMLSEGGKRDGWINIQNADGYNSSLYRIIDSPQPTSYSDPIRRLCYDFVKNKDRGEQFTHQEILDFVIEHLRAENSPLDLVTAKNELSRLIKNSRRAFGIKRTTLYNRGYTTKIQIVDDPALVELAEIVLAILEPDLNKSLIEFGLQRAHEIVNTPRDMANLLDKSDRFSRNSGADVKKTRAMLLDIVSQTTPMSATEIMAAYAELTGSRPPSHESVAQHMQALEQRGKVRITNGTINATGGKATLRYIAYPPQ